MLHLALVGHAPTAAERAFRFPIEEGIEPIQADHGGQLLARLGPSERVVCGPERRNTETAEALGLVPSPCEQLRAWSLGDWSGRTLDWLADHDPQGLRAWQSNPAATPHGGESLLDLLGRVGGWAEAHTTESGRWLLVADPAVLRGLIVHVLTAPAASFWRFDLPPLSVSVIQHAGGQWRLRSLAVEPAQPDTLGHAST
jgi:broad specificity phosphatase PhoE